MPRFLELFSGRLLCLTCSRDFAPRRARFHLLRCKARKVTRSVVNGVVEYEEA